MNVTPNIVADAAALIARRPTSSELFLRVGRDSREVLTRETCTNRRLPTPYADARTVSLGTFNADITIADLIGALQAGLDEIAARRELRAQRIAA